MGGAHYHGTTATIPLWITATWLAPLGECITIHTMSIQETRTLAGQRRLRWMLAMPKIAIALLALAVIGFFWISQHNEREEQRATLIADILWLEQNLRFNMDNGRGLLEQLATTLPEDADPLATFGKNARQILKNHPEFDQLLWVNADNSVRTGHPTRSYPRLLPDPNGKTPLDEPTEFARRLGKPAYAKPYADPNRGTRFEVVVPVFRGEQFVGTLIGIYSLRGILDHLVPWWFAEKYLLQVLNDEGTVIGSKSNVEKTTALITYNLPIDSFGQGIVLHSALVKPPSNAGQRFFVIVISVLAIAVFASLWAIRGLIQRRLAAERELREAHAFRKAMEDSLVTGLRARDLQGRLIYANPAFCRMVGFSTEELVGQLPPMSYWAPESMEETMRMHQAVLHGQAPAEGFEIRFKRKSGEYFDALVYEAPLIDGNGQHVGWMGSVLDITERKRAEEFARQQQEKLQHTSRLVAMGEMASALAHELNQPLSAIASYTTGCLNKLQAGTATTTELTGVLGKMAMQSQRAGKIIRQVYDFIRKREPKQEWCALAEVIDEAVTLFEPMAKKHGVRIERRIQGGLPEVMADPTMLEQVMLNLLRNADEAMAGLPAVQRRIAVSVFREEDHLVVRVADNGPGIPTEIGEKLFTAFFTTKDEGMGMGLSICRSIIEFHHGRLTAENAAGGGAVFLFTLPIEER